MSTALKEDFIPYLPTIVPILLKTASQEIEIPEDEELSEILEGMEVLDVCSIYDGDGNDDDNE